MKLLLSKMSISFNGQNQISSSNYNDLEYRFYNRKNKKGPFGTIL